VRINNVVVVWWYTKIIIDLTSGMLPNNYTVEVRPLN
jgi:hypothetical protein